MIITERVSPTAQYIRVLSGLKPGDLGLLRTHAGQDIDESVAGFDLFTGLWWPLRERNQAAPRRGVAWLVAKLYAMTPLPQGDGNTLARQLRRCQLRIERQQRQFDQLLQLPLTDLEPHLRWALSLIAAHNMPLDWVQLTDDLSIWERESTRLRWAKDFLAL